MTFLRVAGMLGHGGSRAERARARLVAAGAALATWFLFGAANVLALHGQLDDRLGPVANRGTRPGTAFAFGLMILPVAAFLYQTGRLASADRERRLAALRLAGATPGEVRLLGVLETTRAAAVGTVSGAIGYVLLEWSIRGLLLHRPMRAAGVPPVLGLAAMALVIAVAAISGLLAGRHVITSPLGVTRRAAKRPPSRYVLLVPVLGCMPMVARVAGVQMPFRPFALLLGAGLFAVGLMLSASRLVWASARVAGRRARLAETLLAARALEADARPWGRTMSILGLAVAIGSGTGWIQAGIMDDRHVLDPFWLTSFTLVDLALLVGMAVAAAALLVHQAEYLMEHGPVLATLRATGVADGELRRVLTRQGLIAAVLPCSVAALIGFVGLADTGAFHDETWALWPLTNAVLMAALGVLAATLATRASRGRLQRAISPHRLRTE
jgi:predicted lysophospholipase L1 biosynthesis ABC-type transport system permease subunit